MVGKGKKKRKKIVKNNLRHNFPRKTVFFS